MEYAKLIDTIYYISYFMQAPHELVDDAYRITRCFLDLWLRFLQISNKVIKNIYNILYYKYYPFGRETRISHGKYLILL